MLENNEGSPRVETKRVGFCGSGHADVKFVENVRGGGGVRLDTVEILR